METITPKGWASFQHYKDRRPAWIKLHRELLDNYDFHRLPVASKALAPCLWLLASEYEGGHIPADADMIGFRLRMRADEVIDALTPLIHAGFFVASKVLAECKQDACLEKETERETETDIPPPAESAPKAKSVTFKTWMAQFQHGEEVIRSDDPIFGWAKSVGLTDDMIALAWEAFIDRYADDSKLYTDWRAVFRKAVKGNWLRLWFIRDGHYHLTTTGEQVRRVVA